MTFISLAEGGVLYGEPEPKSPIAVRSWVKRFNNRHPEAVIRRRYGLVCKEDLLRAIQIDAEDRTPAMHKAKALQARQIAAREVLNATS